MALNMADLFEHAVDAFPERVALIYGDRQVTYRELEDEANRLAHHLAAQGVGPGDHVGLYARNSVEAVETLLAIIKLRAVAININYRYLAERTGLSPAGLPTCPPSCTIRTWRRSWPPWCRPGLPRVVDRRQTTARPCWPRSGARDFGPRSPDDVYIIYTGGTTGHPKGVMWRHEDIWRTLGGGIDFVTGETAGRRVGAVPDRGRGRRHGPDGARRRSSTAPPWWPRWPACSPGTRP